MFFFYNLLKVGFFQTESLINDFLVKLLFILYEGLEWAIFKVK